MHLLELAEKDLLESHLPGGHRRVLILLSQDLGDDLLAFVIRLEAVRESPTGQEINPLQLRPIEIVEEGSLGVEGCTAVDFVVRVMDPLCLVNQIRPQPHEGTGMDQHIGDLIECAKLVKKCNFQRIQSYLRESLRVFFGADFFVATVAMVQKTLVNTKASIGQDHIPSNIISSV